MHVFAVLADAGCTAEASFSPPRQHTQVIRVEAEEWQRQEVPCKTAVSACVSLQYLVLQKGRSGHSQTRGGQHVHEIGLLAWKRGEYGGRTTLLPLLLLALGPHLIGFGVCDICICICICICIYVYVYMYMYMVPCRRVSGPPSTQNPHVKL